jgi:hypothetical protein
MTAPPLAAASGSDAKTVVVAATVASRMSLKVSTQLLQFEVADGGEAVAAIDFSAGARTQTGGEVVLTVEPMRATEGPGGAADVETSVTFAGEGEGTRSGSLIANAPAVAGRWNGSGLRTGRMVFALRSAAPGSYSLPVRFVLSTP